MIKRIPDLLFIGLGVCLPLLVLIMEPTVSLRPALRFAGLWGVCVLLAVLFYQFVQAGKQRQMLSPFAALVGAAAITLSLLGHWTTVSVVIIQWVAILALGSRVFESFWRPDDLKSSNRQSGISVGVTRTDGLALSTIIGLTLYTLIHTVLNYMKLLGTAQTVLLHLGYMALFPWKSWVLRGWIGKDAIYTFSKPLGSGAQSLEMKNSDDKDWGQTVSRPSPSPLSVSVLIGLAITVGIGWAFLTAVPDNGSDTISAYRAMLIEVWRLGGNVFDPTQTSIGLLSLPPIWNQAVSVVLAGGDLHAAKVWNTSIVIASVFLMSRLPASERPYIGLALGLFVCLTPVVSRLILSPFPDAAALFMTAGALFMFKLFVFTGQGLTVRRAVLLGCVIGLWFLTKYTLIFAILPLTFVVFVFYLWRRPLVETGALLGAGLVAGLIVGAFFGFVYLQTGNPTFPYYNTIFKSPLFILEKMKNPHTGFIDWGLFWIMTVDAPRYAVVGSAMGTLGIGFWVALTAICLTLVKFLQKQTPNFWSVFSALIFIVACIVMSIVENGDRYIIPLLIFAVPIMAWTIQVQKIIPPLALALALILSHFMLIEQWGYGGSEFSFNRMSKHTHTENQNSERSRQYVADHLSETFRNEGNILVFGDDGGTQGHPLLVGWYDMPARQNFFKALFSPDFLAIFPQYLKDNNIDAVSYSPSVHTHLERVDMPAFINMLDSLSEKREVFGGVYVWYLKPELRFETVSDMTLVQETGTGFVNVSTAAKGVLQIELSLTCQGSGAVLNFKSYKGWQDIQNQRLLCDGDTQTIRSPLMSLDAGEFYYQFRDFETIEILSAKAWVRTSRTVN